MRKIASLETENDSLKRSADTLKNEVKKLKLELDIAQVRSFIQLFIITLEYRLSWSYFSKVISKV